jgi:hypothetical protein
MILPTPHPGLVIRYSYLWFHEGQSGLEEGKKSRPCIVLQSFANEGKTKVVVVPITTTKPYDLFSSVEIPDKVKSYLGLEPDKMWAVTAEVNEFDWAGPDISIIPNKAPKTCVYGVIPPKLFTAIRDKYTFVASGKKLKALKRTE